MKIERRKAMKFAARINSFLRMKNHDIEKTFSDFKGLSLGYVDLNYPEHCINYSPQEMKALLDCNDLTLNGVALRFRDKFINGELGNADPKIAEEALDLCKKAADYCREAGGHVVTIWLGFDGFDYSFQINYKKVWNQLVQAYRSICDYAPDLLISIEYKPYEERAYAFLDSMGLTGMMINEVDRANLGITLDYCHMLMKHENPAFAADLFGSRKQLYGIHANDGYGRCDDGLMVGSASPFKTLELLYYLKKNKWDGVIYFDTFPIIEDAVKETKSNMEMMEYMDQLIDKIGLEYIEKIVDRNDAIKASQLMMEFFKGGTNYGL